MKININKDELLENLRKANMIVNKSHPNEVLKNVLIDIKGSTMDLTTSDGTMRTILSIEEINSDENTSFCVNSQLFLDCLKKINKNEVTINTSDKDFIIKSGNRKFKLNIISSDKYPNFADNENIGIIIINANDLLRGAMSTVKTASRNETRPILTGINLSNSEDLKSIVLSATDSYRLSKITLPISNKLNKNINVTIPYQFFEYLNKVIDDSEEEVTILFNDTEIKLEYKNQYITTRLIDGSYPNINRILQGERRNRVKINKEYLNDMIECSFFKDDKNYIITMDFDDNKMTLLNKNNEMGEFKETYEIEHNGNNLSVSVNGEYLKQALSTFESDYVNLYFEDTPLKPFVIVGCEDVDRTLIQLMLPVRTY